MTTYGRAFRLLAVLATALASLCLFSTVASAHAYDNYMKERFHIRRRARRELGVPYSYGGTSPSGFDCSGFTRWTYLDNGADLPHSSEQQFDLAKKRGYVRIWKRSKLAVGDLVFMKTTGARVGHTGIYIGGGRFISATSSEGVRVRSVYDPYYWGPRWVGATRLPVTMRFARRNS
jgi:hypothetical protein